MKKMVLIVNPLSGKMKIQSVLLDVIRMFNEAGYSTQVCVTLRRGHASQIAADAPEDTDIIVCSGGDGTLNEVVRQLYGEHTVTRFRPHHFPFTEPSCEMDIQCHKCHGAGCPTCKGEGWIEVLGAGMIHPKVLEGCGIDSTVYSGWAFGMGLERLALGHFKISDLRLIFENDVRFLEQF